MGGQLDTWGTFPANKRGGVKDRSRAGGCAEYSGSGARNALGLEGEHSGIRS